MQKDGKEQEHSQDKEIAAKLQEIIIAMKDMELRLNQTIMNSQKVVVSQPQVSVPVATPVEPQPAPQNHVEETPVEPEISPEPEEVWSRNRRFRRIWKKTRNRKFCRIWRRAWNRRFRWSRKKIWNRRFCGYTGRGGFKAGGRASDHAADEIILRIRKKPLRKQKNW